MNKYHGKILTTITQTDNPAYQPGQTFHGWYSYNATALDGVFQLSATNGGLTFAIGFPTKPGSLTNHLTPSNLASTSAGNPLLVVTNGAVSYFKLDSEGVFGAYRFFCHVTNPPGLFDGFRVEMILAAEYGSPTATTLHTAGSVTFQPPEMVQAQA